MLKALSKYYLSKNWLIFIQLFTLYLSLKLQNFYPFFFFLIFSIEFYFNFTKKYGKKTYYKFKNRVLKFINENKYLIILATFCSLIGLLKYIMFDDQYKHNLIISDYLNIILFFTLVIFWKFILSEFINLNVFFKSLYIFLIIVLIDTILDFYSNFSILKLSFNKEERVMSFFSTAILGAYIYIIQILLINISFITNQNHKWKIIFLISYTIILYSGSRIPLIFQILTLIFLFLKDINKNFIIKENIIFFSSIFLISIFFYSSIIFSKTNIFSKTKDTIILTDKTTYYDFYNINEAIKLQNCRRINLLYTNIKLVFSSKNITGLNKTEYRQFLHKQELKIGCNEEIKHPHSLLFELIFFYGSVFFVLIIVPFFIIIFRPFKNANAMFFLIIIFFPSGLGSMTSFAWTSIISFIMALLSINKKTE